MKKSLTEEVIEKMKYQILSGEYQPGDRLPTLRELADIYNVSRSVINAVVVDLESNGYIHIVPTKWMEVANWEAEGNLSILTDLINFGLLKEDQLKNLLDGRKFMELECVRLACQNANAKQIAQLKALVIEEAAEEDPKKRANYDVRFHYLISQLSGNFVYAIIINTFSSSGVALISSFYDESVLDFVTKKHEEILNAIEAKQEAIAVSAMEALLDHGESIIREKLKNRR